MLSSQLTRRSILTRIATITALAPVRRAFSDTMSSQTKSAINAPDFAKRIACIGGVITEVIYRLGADARICAVDDTSTWPNAALRDKAHLGYMRMIAAEGTLSTRPDLILALDGAGPANALSTLKSSGIPLITVDDTATPDAALRRIGILARVIGRLEAGRALQNDTKRGFEEVAQAATRVLHRPKILFVLHVSNNRLICGGARSSADQIIRLCHAENAIVGFTGYKLLNPEELAALQPDVVLATRENGTGIRSLLLKDAGFQMTPAGQKKAILTVDGQALLSFGPRTPSALMALINKIERAS